jgi:hypothetical protein
MAISRLFEYMDYVPTVRYVVIKVMASRIDTPVISTFRPFWENVVVKSPSDL